jgi:glucokinase
VSTPTVGFVLAVDVGGTSTKAEVLDVAGRTVVAGSTGTPRGDGDGALQAVGDLALDLLAGLDPATRAAVDRVAVAVPGLVDTEAGVSVLAANLGWRNTPVAQVLSDRTGLPVVLGHDVTSAGTAEWRLGAGRGVDDLLVVVIGTGIAATVVAGGRLLRGGPHQAGEIGHVVVRPDGPVCACGARGCLEAIASARAIADRYEDLSGRPVAGAADVHALLGRDACADQAWDEAVDALADGLLTAVTLLAPSRVVLGGGLSHAGAALIDPVRDRMVRRARVVSVPPIVAGELGSRAGVLGASLLQGPVRVAGAAL